MAYATPAQMCVRYDVRTLGDLVSDSGVRVTREALTADANLLAALDDASGEIDAALLMGKRYSSADLTGLTGNSAAYLVRLTCTIAFWRLWERRPWSEGDEGRDRASDDARAALDRLRKGEHVFDVEGPKDAGLPTAHSPSVTAITNKNLTIDVARGHFYPSRRYPVGE